jgi:hypothetical protein
VSSNAEIKNEVLFETPISVPYNWSLFYAAIGKYKVGEVAPDLKVVGAIVPHHDLAAEYTAELFQKIGNRDISTIIIVGPNHSNSGAGDIITGAVVYNLLDSDVHSEASLVAQLIKDKVAVSDSLTLNTEHSIYNIVPYVNYYFPVAKIVPIILSGRVSETQSENLGKYLAANLNEHTLIIASIDFSHYLNTDEARAHDSETRSALLSHNYSRLYSFTNDNIDSPPTAVTVLSATDLVKATNVEIIRNKNQADATGVSSVDSSTSYFTILLNTVTK